MKSENSQIGGIKKSTKDTNHVPKSLEKLKSLNRMRTEEKKKQN